MAHLPPRPVVRAAVRWLRLLRSYTMTQSWTLIRADSSYTDITLTQYSDALDWLMATEVLTIASGKLSMKWGLSKLPSVQMHQLLFARALEEAGPSWLPDSDILVADSSEIPHDAAMLATELDISDSAAFSLIREVHGQIDLQQRELVGSAGELALIKLLEECWPGSTIHVSLIDDGLGYDIALIFGTEEWHLEVKSTTRRGRLVIYLSRHEHEIARVDRDWRLVVVGLRKDHSPAAIALIDYEQLAQQAPMDIDQSSTWMNVRYQIPGTAIRPGLEFIDDHSDLSHNLGKHNLLRKGFEQDEIFAWMPRTS